MTDNGYVCFYRSKRVEVYAPTSLAAQQKAAKQLGARRSSEVTVVLAEKGGEPVIHSGAEF